MGLLFSKYDWHSIQQHQVKKLKEDIANYDGNCLLNTSVDDLCDYYITKFSVNVPVLDVNSIVADQKEAKIDVSGDPRYGSRFDGSPVLVDGSTVELEVPFTGESEVFNIRPTTFDFNPPRASVRKNSIILLLTGINQSSEQVKSEFDRLIKNIETYLANLHSNAGAFNSKLDELARGLIESRREKLLANQNLVASLGFALKKNPDASKTYSAPSVQRKITHAPPKASSAPYKPEPCLSTKDYDHILEVIQNMTHVMERSPSAFAGMDEEDLRTHFLVQLNGHYEGQATGETFNYEGKTDVLIRENGKNIFIGECKFWGGPKKLTETINQLLGYSSWRDTKVAILLFNRNKDLSKVLVAAQESIEGHENHKKTLRPQSETSFRYLFSHRDDSNREMILALLVFDVPN